MNRKARLGIGLLTVLMTLTTISPAFARGEPEFCNRHPRRPICRNHK